MIGVLCHLLRRDTILDAIPHTHRNRWLPAEERGVLIGCHDRKEHRGAERLLNKPKRKKGKA